jgi:hypothetical protein
MAILPVSGSPTTADRVAWLGVGVVVAVLAAGGAGPGLAAVGVAVDGPVALVFEAVVVSAEAVEVVCGGFAAGGEGFAVVDVGEFGGPVADESAWGAVSRLLGVRFPRPLAEPAVRLSTQRALHGICRRVVQTVWVQGLGILLPR